MDATLHQTGSSRRTWLGRGLGRMQAHLRTRWRPRRIYLHVPPPSEGQAGHAAALQAFSQWCNDNAGSVCEVGLPSHVLLTSLRHDGGDRQAAQQQALADWAHYHDLDMEALAQHWVIRQVHAPEIALVCAMPRTLLDGLLEHAAMHAVRVNWIGPWWVRGLRSWLRHGEPGPQAHHGLQLSEPGYLTRVDAVGSGLGRVACKMWLEAGLIETPADDTLILCAPARHQPGDQAGNAHAAVWDHAGIAEVLAGHRTQRGGGVS